MKPMKQTTRRILACLLALLMVALPIIFVLLCYVMLVPVKKENLGEEPL